MKVAIHQPQYWPWPPYIHKIMSADVFVYLDSVQFSKNGYQNRNQIKTSSGACWLTLPVKHRLGQDISETKIQDSSALRKHLKTLEASYAATSGYKRWKDELQTLLESGADSLCDTTIASTEWLLDKLGVQTPRLKASEISGVNGHGSALIVSICKALGATSYLSGRGALAYMAEDDFSGNQWETWVQEWTAPVYQQAFSKSGFVPNLSTLDLLLSCPDGADQLIRSAGSWTLLWDGV